MKKLSAMLLAFLFVSRLFAQSHKTQNIVIVTLDGFRWQELYRGADSALINSKYTDTKADVKKKFWAETPEQRRKLLMPFFWRCYTPCSAEAETASSGGVPRAAIALVLNHMRF